MPEPLTALAAGAAEQHELFMAWVHAGFTRAEALQLLLGVIGAGLAMSQFQPPEDGHG